MFVAVVTQLVNHRATCTSAEVHGRSTRADWRHEQDIGHRSGPSVRRGQKLHTTARGWLRVAFLPGQRTWPA